MAFAIKFIKMVANLRNDYLFTSLHLFVSCFPNWWLSNCTLFNSSCFSSECRMWLLLLVVFHEYWLLEGMTTLFSSWALWFVVLFTHEILKNLGLRFLHFTLTLRWMNVSFSTLLTFLYSCLYVVFAWVFPIVSSRIHFRRYFQYFIALSSVSNGRIHLLN